MIHNEFDSESKAIINPENNYDKIEGFPKICIGVFSDTIVNQFINEFGGEVIAELKYCSGSIPIYKTTIYGTEIAFYVPHVGAPSAASGMEEIFARGAKYFVYFGSCGVLRHDIADGHLIVPSVAIRDEGTSYHYIPAADEIKLDSDCIAIVEEAMKNLGLPYVKGKTWTTDAFYRETPKKMQRRKEQGCICVEMECSALAAVSQFREFKFAEFFYAADNLDAPEWDSRGLDKRGESVADKCMSAAVEIGKMMKKAFE